MTDNQTNRITHYTSCALIMAAFVAGWLIGEFSAGAGMAPNRLEAVQFFAYTWFAGNERGYVVGGYMIPTTLFWGLTLSILHMLGRFKLGQLLSVGAVAAMILTYASMFFMHATGFTELRFIHLRRILAVFLILAIIGAITIAARSSENRFRPWLPVLLSACFLPVVSLIPGLPELCSEACNK